MANRRKNYETTMRIRAILFIVVFLLMVAVIISLLNGMGISFGKEEKEAPEPSVEPTSVLSMPPIQTQALPTETPEIIIIPEPSFDIIIEPEPSLTPTPEPIQIPETYGVVLDSGTIRSDTGVGLNLVADWTAVSMPDGKADITVTVSLENYGITSIAQPVTISVGSDSSTLNGQAINYDGTQGLKKSELATQTFTVNLPAGTSGSFRIAASWMFNGTYSGKMFTTIDCEQTVVLER